MPRVGPERTQESGSGAEQDAVEEESSVPKMAAIDPGATGPGSKVASLTIPPGLMSGYSAGGRNATGTSRTLLALVANSIFPHALWLGEHPPRMEIWPGVVPAPPLWQSGNCSSPLAVNVIV